MRWLESAGIVGTTEAQPDSKFREDANPFASTPLRVENANSSPEELALITCHLSQMASLRDEHALALARMSEDLLQHNAPPKLVTRLRRAHAEKELHARILRQLSRCRSTPTVLVTSHLARSLGEIALENATAGCVVRTFDALLTYFQAVHAENEAVRSAMRTMAPVETEHAELAWDLHAWFRNQLPSLDLLLLQDAQRLGRRALLAQVDFDLEPRARRLLGLPDAGDRALLVQSLFETLPLAA